MTESSIVICEAEHIVVIHTSEVVKHLFNVKTNNYYPLTGAAVIMVQSVGQDAHFIGTGTIEDQAIDTASSHIQLRITSISSVASSIASVGQLVRWPKATLVAVSSQSPKASNVEENSLSHNEEDRVMNYALQVIQLGVFPMQLNDTEKEGDGERCLMNWKLLILYFRSRNRGMKYAFEAMRLITHTKALLTEHLPHRVIHGQFINTKVVLAIIWQTTLRWKIWSGIIRKSYEDFAETRPLKLINERQVRHMA